MFRPPSVAIITLYGIHQLLIYNSFTFCISCLCNSLMDICFILFSSMTTADIFDFKSVTYLYVQTVLIIYIILLVTVYFVNNDVLRNLPKFCLLYRKVSFLYILAKLLQSNMLCQ
jgi:hypothetical protein